MLRSLRSGPDDSPSSHAFGVLLAAALVLCWGCSMDEPPAPSPSDLGGGVGPADFGDAAAVEDAGDASPPSDDAGRDFGDAAGNDAGRDASDDAGDDAMTPTGRCGNGVIEGNEECDDQNMSEEDACLNDCRLACGDGRLQPVEKCDPAITVGMPGACPTGCDTGDACLDGSLSGTGCDVECVTAPITACATGDGCCAPGCDATADSDCSPVCGNGVVEGTETCDGNCPMGCDDQDACTEDVQMGAAATCDTLCQSTPITACVTGDGCCAPGCDATLDRDCSASCGNGVVEGSETCDGDCPMGCEDQDACTTDTLVGAASMCTAMCRNVAVTMCTSGDGCCPSGCTSASDLDCSATCGNGVLDAGELCDDGNMTPNDGCTNCQTDPTVFRPVDLDLRDPHIYVDFGPLGGCQDLTDRPAPFNFATSINQQLQTSIQNDNDGDGFLDLSFLLLFRPLARGATMPQTFQFAPGNCTAPMATTSCTQPAAGIVETTTYRTGPVAPQLTCLDVLMGTTTASRYTPSISSPTSPCFFSDPLTVTLSISGTQVPLKSAQVAAEFVGNPATSMTNGLIRGFLSEADANAILLPSSLPLIGGKPLSSVLPGGMGSCAQLSDKDMGPDGMGGTTTGWWFYMNFTSSKVTYTGP